MKTTTKGLLTALTAASMLLPSISSAKKTNDIKSLFKSTKTQLSKSKASQVKKNSLSFNNNSSLMQRNFIKIKDTKKESHNLFINEKALDQEFLLRGNLITQNPLPNFSNLKTRVVSFKKVSPERVVMLESGDGHNVSTDLSSTYILAEFDVVAEGDGWLEFDFNEGMSDLFIAGDWYAQDFSGPGYQDTFMSVPTNITYLDSVKMTDSEIAISQYVQINSSLLPLIVGLGGTYQVKYFLSPYSPSEDFEPTISKANMFKETGYFETAPYMTKAGTPVSFATKFNINKDITFAISSNTPEEYKEAVKDGILYFNKIFKKEIIKVVDAPKGITAPHPDYNIVQWADWDTAGFAYADAQSDPRTGEILNAQVFFTSVFGISGKVRARKILQRLKEAKKNKTHKSHTHKLGLKGFAKSTLCDLNAHDSKLEESLTELVNSDADDAKILKASQDYIREVVAHEIGHTLGMRHNFAGNIATNYSMDKRDDIIKSYMNDGKTPEGIIPSSSVMEYTRFEEAAMLGDLIAQGKSFSYDNKLIKKLYYNEDTDPNDEVLFCTDSHRGAFADCQVFDIGNSVIEAAKYEERKAFEGLNKTLVEIYVSAKDPAYGRDKIEVEDVTLSADRLAAALLGNRAMTLAATQKGFPLLRITRKFDAIDSTNVEKVKKAHADYAEAEIKANGGLSKLLMRLPTDWAETQLSDLKTLLESGAYDKTVGPGGNTVELTADDQKIILDKMTALYPMVQTSIEKAALAQLTATGVNWSTRTLAEDMTDVLLDNALYYNTHVTGETVTGVLKGAKDDKGVRPELLVELPEFTYETPLRAEAAALISKTSTEYFRLGDKEKKAMKKEYTKFYKGIFKDKKHTGFALDDQSYDLGEWLHINGSTLGLLL